jgi:hypothetical protein
LVVNWSADSSRVPPEIQLRDSLNRAQDGNGATPSTMLDLLDAMTKPQDDEVFRKLSDVHGHLFHKFEDFVRAARPYGMGLADKGELRKQLALHHKEEREPYRRAATVERMAAMRQRVEQLLHDETEPELFDGGDRRSSEFQSRATRLKTPGESDDVERVVARLKRDAARDPDVANLAAKVISGEVKPNAAARQMGWRKPRIVLSSPERVAVRLRDHFKDPEQRRLLAELLTKEEEN